MVLPFPFDQVENFFRQLFTDIARAVAGVVGDVVGGVNSILSGIKDFISSKISGLQTIVWNQLLAMKDQILGALSGVGPAVAGLLGGIEQAVRPFFDSVVGTVQGVFSSINSFLQNTLFPFLQNLSRNIRADTQAVFGAVSSVVAPAVEQVRQVASQIQTQVFNLPAAFWEQLTIWGTAITEQFATSTKSLSDQNNQLFQVSSNVVQGTQDLISGFNMFSFDVGQQFASLQTNISNFFAPLINFIGSAAQGMREQFLDPIIGFLQGMPSMVQNVLAPTGSITPEDARTMMFALGGPSLGAYAAANAFGIIAEFGTAGQVDEVARGIIDTLDDVGVDVFATDLITFDYEVGVKPALTREVLRRYVPNIPGTGDLVNMVVKEAFVPELRTPAPDIFKQFMRETGFDDFWSDTFWTAHWTPIDLGSITTMFHRGIIDEADFIRRLIILDFRPDDTELVKQLTFKLPNRIEARLMARFGILTDEQLDEIIQAEGVREDFVVPLRTMMQDFNLTNIFTRTESTATSAYEKGLINKSQATQLLQQIKRPPNVINADLQLMDLKRNLEFQEDELKIIEKAAKRGNITTEEALSLFQGIGIDSEVASLKVALIQFELDVSTSQDVKKAAPKLTAIQIAKAVKQGIISAEDGLSALQAKGFSAEEAQVLFTIQGAVEV